MGPWSVVRLTVMLPLCCQSVASLLPVVLPLKLLIDNEVTDVATLGSAIIFYLLEIPVYFGPLRSGGLVLKWCHGKFKFYQGQS